MMKKTSAVVLPMLRRCGNARYDYYSSSSCSSASSYSACRHLLSPVLLSCGEAATVDAVVPSSDHAHLLRRSRPRTAGDRRSLWFHDEAKANSDRPRHSRTADSARGRTDGWPVWDGTSPLGGTSTTVVVAPPVRRRYFTTRGSSGQEGGHHDNIDPSDDSDSTTPIGVVSSADTDDAATDDGATTAAVPETATATVTIPGAQTGGRKLAIVYTCNVCQTRSIKQFTAQAYEHGVVLVRCPGCQNLHLIADRLGYFADDEHHGKNWDVERLVTSTGQSLTRVVTDDNVLELTPEDLLGREKLDELLERLAHDDGTAAEDDHEPKDEAPTPVPPIVR